MVQNKIIDTVILSLFFFNIVLVCYTESDEFTRLDYANSDAACSNYTASTAEVNVHSSVLFIIFD